MSNSPLVVYTRISPNSNARSAKISAIIPHHMASTALTIELCGAEFARPERKASSNYGIGSDGRVALYVDESRRSWCSSNWQADNKSVTMEIQNSAKGPDWPVSDAALESAVSLCVDICRRNGIPRLNYTGDTSGNLLMHKWFAATGCPGPYLGEKFPYIAAEVNRRLGVEEDPPEVPAEKPADALAVGDIITLVPGTRYTTGKEVPEWVMKKTLYCRALIGSNVSFSIYREGDGGITGVTAVENVRKKGQAPVQQNPQAAPEAAEPAELEVGDIITLKEDAAYITGARVPDWVREKTLYCRGIFSNGNIAFSIYPEGLGGITGYVDRSAVVRQEPEEPEEKLADGDVIILAEDAVYTTGGAIPAWVLARTIYCRGYAGSEAIIFSIQKTGAITGFVDLKCVRKA